MFATVFSALLLITDPSAGTGRELSWNGYATSAVGGRVLSAVPTFGSPTFPPPPGGQQPDGCRLEIYVGPNPMPAKPDILDRRFVRFYKSFPNYPPDVCTLAPGRFVMITGELPNVLCDTNACKFGVLNILGLTLAVRP